MEWIEFVLVVSSTLIWNPVRRQYPPPRNPTACTLIGQYVLGMDDMSREYLNTQQMALNHPHYQINLKRDINVRRSSKQSNQIEHTSMEFFVSKPNVPQFIMKIFYILERNEFEDVICWSSNSSEIQIKNAKALEEKVLPLYFRHKKIESFIRQLNMYRFSKINKLNKEKTHMFFKNQLFKRGQIDSLPLIKRKKKGQGEDLEGEMQDNEHIENLETYKEFIKDNITQIQSQLKKLKKTHPYLLGELGKIHHFCNVLIGDDHQLNAFVSTQDVVSNNNFFKTFKDLVSSLNNFDSQCSIEMQIKQE